MSTSLAYVAAGAIVAFSFVAVASSASAASAKTTPGCSASIALGAIADGLSSTAGTGSHPEDARTLAAALKTSAQLRACGNERDSISAELIAADAFSDVYPNDPGKRCAALRDARTRLRALGDLKRADLVRRTIATGPGCLRARGRKTTGGTQKTRG